MGWIVVQRPCEVGRAVPVGVVGRFPRIRSGLGVAQVWKVRVNGSKMIVQEAKWRVVDDVGGDDKLSWV